MNAPVAATPAPAAPTAAPAPVIVAQAGAAAAPSAPGQGIAAPAPAATAAPAATRLEIPPPPPGQPVEVQVAPGMRLLLSDAQFLPPQAKYLVQGDDLVGFFRRHRAQKERDPVVEVLVHRYNPLRSM